ncbi:hypothetical protein WBJ53_26155 [Spirosoma sp. SC4-14]|uniref:hypothetical protein n=1 Tax=Spirosoma sp. SC4-14 TaxID=3128900 RepID=UPI0030CFFEB2
MRKLLVLLLLLITGFNALAQTINVPVEIRVKATNAFSYSVSAPRNYQTYPLNDVGKAAFERAVVAGAFSLTTTDGCIIPPGTKPPKIKPTCTTTPSYTVVQVAYSQSVESESASGPGNNFGSIKDGELTYSVTSVPVPGSYTLVLAYQSTTNPPTALISVNGGSTVSLPLEASDGGPRSASAVLSGFTAGTNSINIKQNGYFASDKITVSKYGSVTVTDGTTTDPGSQTSDPGSQTVAGSFSYQVPTTSSPWSYTSTEQIGFLHIPIGAVDFMENEFLRLELRAGLGALVQVKDKVTGRWLINSPDLGRGMGPSSYTQQHYTDNTSYVDGNGNHPFSSNGPAPAPGPWFTGYNPLLNGDWVGHPSTVLFHGRITIEGIEYIYVKTQQNSWSHDDNRMLRMYTEQWVSLQGKKVLIKTRLTHDRTDDLTDYGPYMQEWRMMMVNGIQQAVYYNGQNPYSYAATTKSNGIERREADGTYIKPGRAFPVSEPWIGVTVDNTGRMIAHYAPDLYFPSYNHMDPQEGSDCDGCREGMYTAGHVMANLDAKGVWLFSDTWIVGTEAEVREYVYAQPRVGAPNWVFNASTQRNFWHGNNGVHDGQLPNAATDANGWVFDMVGKADGGPANIDNTYISSPRTAFKGSDCPTLYVKAKLSNTSQTAWKVKYTYVGQERETLNADYPNENAKRFPYSPQLASSNTPVNFTMTANGSIQTYAIPMNWNTSSYISTVEVWPNGSNMQTVPHFEILSIGCTNPN